jgi:hypothetical protein
MSSPPFAKKRKQKEVVVPIPPKKLKKEEMEKTEKPKVASLLWAIY